ncbi:antiviral reverse transcriptase Drt3b [Clostridium paraputrificum]|uniref:antiviral reverse transcriptase Drt3b n=1 Tax=Clostridium paraputrificum TaxID=29363 RepID=UPI003D331C42
MDKIEKLVLLKTDTLPYEVPLIYNNEKLIKYINDDRLNDDLWSKISKEKLMEIQRTRPYIFKIFKNDNEYRELYLCHPLAQLYMVKFIEVYETELLNYFNLNHGFSLRKPTMVNLKHLKNKKYIKTEFKKIFLKDIEEDSNDYYDYIDSYFVKKPFLKITDFYSSYKMQRMEMKYNYLRKIDISKCFYNIYTHSIEWAFLGSKEEAKKNNRILKFGTALDKIMQNSNYGETNGIIVGPEFSRIVAEIILCRVDRQILMKEEKYKYKRDFEVARFMDDIFIFSNKEEVLDSIEKNFRNELFDFKLSINNDKVKTYKTPFLEEQIWISDLKNILYIYRESFNTNNLLDREDYWRIKKEINHKDKNCFESTRIILMKNRSQKEYIVSYILTYMDRSLEKVLRYNQDGLSQVIEQNIVRIIDFVSYFISFNVSANNTLKFCKILIKINKKYNSIFNNLDDYIYKKTFELIKYNKKEFVDMQNLIIMLTFIDKDLPEDLLIEEIKGFDYFTLSVISFYISYGSRRYRYSKLRKKINMLLNESVENSIEKIECGYYSCKEMSRDFDIIIYNDFFNCPIIEANLKNKISKVRSLLEKEVKGKGYKEGFDKFFYGFIKDFNNSFIKWDATEEDVIKAMIMKTSYNNIY